MQTDYAFGVKVHVLKKEIPNIAENAFITVFNTHFMVFNFLFSLFEMELHFILKKEKI